MRNPPRKLCPTEAGSSYPASLVGSYPSNDLTVIKLDSPPGGQRPAHFGDSAKLAIGDIVLGMGNPLGLTGSVTNGIISGSCPRLRLRTPPSPRRRNTSEPLRTIDCLRALILWALMVHRITRRC